MKKSSLVLLFILLWAPAAAQGQRVDPELLLARQITADQGLFFALARNDVQSMLTLRNQGANPNASMSILGLRVRDVFGETSTVKDVLIVDNFDEDAGTQSFLDFMQAQPFDPSGWPILHWAVYLGNLDAVKLLLRGGALVNAVDVYGATALHWAAGGSRHSIARLLLNNGASCWATDIKRRAPKDWAIIASQNDTVTLLASRCRPGAFKDSDGDGVPDHLDLCPNTPLGAQVDERGCWVAAYANFFDFDKAIVKSQYLPHLANAAEVIKNHPGLKVDIQGHTDSVGSDEYNLKLGYRRAEAVKKVLEANGVSSHQMQLSSMGERQPIADNRSSKGRALNRRVEIHVGEPGAPSNVGAYRPGLAYPIPAPTPAPRAAPKPRPKAAVKAEVPEVPAVPAAPPPSAPPLPPSAYPLDGVPVVR